MADQALKTASRRQAARQIVGSLTKGWNMASEYLTGWVGAACRAIRFGLRPAARVAGQNFPRLILSLAAVEVLLACAVGCGGPWGTPATPGDEPVGSNPIRVVTTVGMVADIVRNVGGDRVEVRQLMGDGVDPHLYKPTRNDVRALMSAQIVFYCGLMLEGKMASVLEKFGQSRPSIPVTRGIAPSLLIGGGGDSQHADPHVWMDVSLWQMAVVEVERELAAFDPQHAEYFRQRAARYLVDLQTLHDLGVELLGRVPEQRRILITSHDAFRYFGRAYGVRVEGVQGISTESEAGLRRINELVDLVVGQGISAIFVESSVSQKSIESLVAGARSRNHRVAIGGPLYSDAMGEAGTPAGTYIGMMEHNFRLIASLLGDIPADDGKVRND